MKKQQRKSPISFLIFVLVILLGIVTLKKTKSHNWKLTGSYLQNSSTEPTINEVRNEIIKQAEKSSISIWLSVASFGGAIALVGVPFSVQGQLSLGLPISLIGVVFMLWARIMAKKRQKAFITKWHEEPRY